LTLIAFLGYDIFMARKRYVTLLLFSFLLVASLVIALLFLVFSAPQSQPTSLTDTEFSQENLLPTIPPIDLTHESNDASPQDKQQQVLSAYTLWTATERTDKTIDHRFYKVSEQGDLLSEDAVLWSCVYDDLTGLLWEVKTSDGSWRDAEHSYSWFQPSPQEIENLSLVAGSDATTLLYDAKRGKADGGACYDVYCDTYHYNQAFNEIGVCGAQQWRLPYAHELGYLDHKDQYYPDIDTTFFPNTAVAYYWSRTETPNLPSLAWAVDFKDGFPYISEKRIPYRIRLVVDALWLSEKVTPSN